MTAFEIVSAVFAFVAAWFWFRSTRVKPPEHFGWGIIAPNDYKDRVAPGLAWAEKVSTENKRGALFSGLSVACLGLSVVFKLVLGD